MSGIATAIGGSALLGYLGSQQAAGQQASAAGNANATQWNMYNQNQSNLAPWLQSGGAANSQLAYLMGLPGYGPQLGSMGMAGQYQPEGRVSRLQPGTAGGQISGSGFSPLQLTNDQQSAWASSGYDPSMLASFQSAWDQGQGSLGSAMAGGQAGGTNQYNPAMGAYGSLSTPFSATNFQTDPGYQFRLGEGTKALERSAAARGMGLSGAQSKALANYNQNFASNEYNNVYNRYNNDQNNLYNRLSGMSGTGLSAGNAIAGVGSNTANQVSNNQMNLGAGQSASTLAGYNSLGGGLNQWANMTNWNNNNPWTGYGSQMNPSNSGWGFGPPRG